MTIPEVLLPEDICCLEFPECTCGLNEDLEPITRADLANLYVHPCS
jgi:hypothetical protein